MFPAEPLPERIGAYRVLRRLSAQGAADQYLCREDGPSGFSRDVVLKLAERDAPPSASVETWRSCAADLLMSDDRLC